MHVLIVNSYYSKGGASRAALRLAKALPLAGVKVTYKSIYPLSSGFLNKLVYYWRVILDRLPGAFISKKRVMFSCGTISNRSVVKEINRSDADLVHLHWINAGGMSFDDISKIEKPVVWTLHDNWAFTGGCHVMQSCENYKSGCGSCFVLDSNSNDDLSHKLLLKKNTSYAKIKNLTIVAPSQWMATCAKRSLLLGTRKIVNLPNPIDIDLFSPFPQEAIRTRLGLPKDKFLVLFGAISATQDKNKGYEQLVSALNLISSENEIELVIFGGDRPVHGPDLPFKSHFLGHISDDIKLRELYSASDVTVVPSLQENLSNTIMESLSCGTPVVCFDIGGNGDMVEHKVNGYLSKPYESASLSEGIMWILGSKNKIDISRNARSKVITCFSNKNVAEKYKQLYADCLDSNALD